MAPPGKRPAPPTGAVKIILLYAYGGRNMLNILWTSVGSGPPPTAAQLVTYATSVQTAWNAHITPVLSQNISLLSVTCEYYGAGPTIISGVSTGASAPGGVSGNSWPSQVCVAISWLTGLYYRGGKPRTYLGGIPESYLASGAAYQISPTAAASIDAGADAFLTAFNALSLAGTTTLLSLMSFASRGAWRNPPVPYQITGAKVSVRIDTQRRRLGKETIFYT